MANKSTVEKKTNDQDRLKAFHQEIEKVAESAGAKLPPEKKAQLAKILTGIFVDGKLPSEAMGFDENFIKQLYGLAYNRYNLGLYKDADMMFRFLCLLDPTSARFRLGLAATNHRLKKYDLAIMLYFCVVNCDPGNPLPLFYCYDCYMNIDNPLGAYCALKVASEICEKKPEHAQLGARCQQMMDGLQERFDVLGKTKKGKEPKG